MRMRMRKETGLSAFLRGGVLFSVGIARHT